MENCTPTCLTTTEQQLLVDWLGIDLTAMHQDDIEPGDYVTDDGLIWRRATA
jgi:hypothetical protein